MDGNENRNDYAGHVYLLMGKKYRISRSIRGQWFFQHIKSLVCAPSNEKIIPSQEELEIISVIPENAYLHDQNHSSKWCLVPSTNITFIGREYKFAFCFDLSPSVATVDVESGLVLLEEMFENFKNCVSGLVQPFCVPGSNLRLKPDLRITVLAHLPVAKNACQVLIQGYHLTLDSLTEFLVTVQSKLIDAEDYLADCISEANRASKESQSTDRRRPESFLPPEASLFMMFRDCLLALQLLPDNASAGLVIITDGAFGLIDANAVDAVLAQMRASTVVCSFLMAGKCSPCFTMRYGYVAQFALMQFIATATSGAYIAYSPKIQPDDGSAFLLGIKGKPEMNIYHHSLYCWSFQQDVDQDKILTNESKARNAIANVHPSLITTSVSPGSSLLSPHVVHTIKIFETKLNTRIASVLSVRLREGYCIDRVTLSKDGTHLDVKMLLPWKEHVFVEYYAKAAWPLDHTRKQTNVEMHVGGLYEFLHDLRSKSKNFAYYRKTVIKKFELFVKSLQSTDELLVRLQSFSSNPLYYKIPESAKSAVPLFYLPPNSATPVLSHQHGHSHGHGRSSHGNRKNTHKSDESQFASFWKPVLSLDPKTWQRWFHSHRVSLVLENDRPIPSSLFLSSSNGRYSSVHCRVAMSSLNVLLKEWSSFVLLENHSYVRFLSKSNEERPYSFCLLRLQFKGLSIVIRTAFLGGTAGSERHMVVSDLKEKLAALIIPNNKPLFAIDASPPDSPLKSLQDRKDQLKCVLFMGKPLERILIKYDAIPEDLINDDNSDGSGSQHPGSISGSPDKGSDVLQTAQTNSYVSNTRLNTLSLSLYSQRWIWRMSYGGSNSLSKVAVAKILLALTKTRLQEGFHFGSSSGGIITLVKELQMKSRKFEPYELAPCVLQFVLFPPHHASGGSRHGLNEDATESDYYFDTGTELQMVTEIWIEPQFGYVVPKDEAAICFKDLTFIDLAKTIFNIDKNLIEEMATYACLESLCNQRLLSPEISPSTYESASLYSQGNIVKIPFLYNLISLLQQSNSVLMCYPLLRKSQELNDTESSSKYQNSILIDLVSVNLHQIHNISLSMDDITEDVNNFLSSCCLQQMMEYGMLLASSNSEHPLSDIKWNGFAREANSRLLLTFIPSSMDDINAMLKSNDLSTEDKITNTTSNETTSCPVLPVIVFECCNSNLGAVAKQECDKIFQDYTTAFLDVDVDISQTDVKKSNLHSAFKDGTLLREHCHLIYERYFRSFVGGVFENLQRGQVLDKQDVDSSVEMICEESCIQIDITDFVRILCSHYQQISILSHDDDVFSTDKSSDNLMDVIPPSLKRSSGSSSSQKQSKVKCDREEIHTIVQERFRHIMERSFHAISNHKHVFFYVKPSAHTEFESLSILSDDVNDINDFFDFDFNHTGVRTKDIDEDPLTNLSQFSGRSLKGSTACAISHSSSESVEMLSTVDTMSVDSATMNNKLEEQEIVPLFIHLTSSIKYHTEDGTSISTCSVDSLPTCIADLVAKASSTDQDQSIPDTLANVHSITLDLNCLTLPHETESDDITRSKSPLRQLVTEYHDDEIQSQVADGSISAEGTVTSRTYTEQESLIDEGPKSAIALLPRAQQNALTETSDAIDWLLKDEIASSLRSVQPVNVETLSRVEEHINMAVQKSSAKNLKKTNLPLKFVFGFEQSIDYFVDRLEQTNLNGYVLLKADNYYYVAKSPEEFQQESSFGKNATKALTSSEKELCKSETKDLSWDVQQNGNPVIESVPQIGISSESSEIAFLSIPDMDRAALCSSEAAVDIQDLDLLGPPRARSNTFPRSPGNVDTKSVSQTSPRRRSSSITEETLLKSRSITYPLETGDSKSLRKIVAHHNLFANRREHSDETKEDTATVYKTKIIDQYGNSYNNDLGDDFWIFLKIEQGGFGPVYFHERKSLTTGNQHDQLYESLLNCMEEICMLVNQKMLLDDLYEADMCRDILIAPDDEEWSSTRAESTLPLYLNTPGSKLSSVVRTEVEFDPGHFECGQVWHTYIPLHYRLKPPVSQGNVSRGFMAAKSILDSFTISNRINLFVFKEESGNVFYFRIREVTFQADQISLRKIEEDATREEVFSMQSRTSSLMSVQSTAYQASVTGQVQPLESPQEYVPKRTGSIASGDGNSLLDVSPWGIYTGTEDFIHFSVYGIHQPGPSIKIDLIQSLKKSLDEVTLKRLNLLLTRNPKSKLALPDVHFIQPPCRPPVCSLRFGLPPIMHPYTHSFMYYLRQLLLVEFNTPRYVDSQRDQFRNYAQYDSKSRWLDYPVIPINDLYLYVERGKEGVYVGCFYLSLVNRNGELVKAHPVTPTPAYTNKSPDYYRKWLETLMSCVDEQQCEEGETWQSNECEVYVQFSIWGRGEISLASLISCLRGNVKSAISDVFLEYILLANAISSLPPSLVRASFRSHSSSSKGDTPTSPYFKTISAHSITSQDSINRSTKSTTGTPCSPMPQSPLPEVPIVPLASPSPNEVKQRVSKKLSLPAVMRPRTTPTHCTEVTETVNLKSLESSTPSSESETGIRSTPKRRSSTADHRRHNSNPFPLQPELQLAKDLSMKGRHGSTVESPEMVGSDNAAETSRWQDIELRRRKEATVKQERCSYEAGTKGNLSSSYVEPIKDCFDCISKLSSPSIHTHTKILSSDYSVSSVLRESVKILSDLFPEIKPVIFTKVESSSGGDLMSLPELVDNTERKQTKAKYVPYHLEREAIKVGGKEESSMDIRRLPSFIPRPSSNFVVILRNVHQWRSCMGIHEEDLEGKGAMSTDEQFSRQRFPPFEISGSSSQESRRSLAAHNAPSCLRVAPIPRQKFFALYFEGRQVSLYSYNISKEMRSVIDNRLLRLYAWHQARDHLNRCIMMQKAGLFHHMAFESAGQNEDDENLLTFCSTNNHNHLVLLMKDGAPPSTDRLPPSDDRSNKLTSQLPLQLMYRDSSPHRILSRAPYRFIQDPVKRFGCQYHEIRHVKMTNVVQQAKISEVHDMWMRGEVLPISEDRLNLLLHHSRIVHFGEVKVLFDTIGQQNLETSNTETKLRDKLIASSLQRMDSRSEEEKHRDLASILLKEYSLSVEVLGFSPIQIGQSSRRNVKSQPSDINQAYSTKKIKYLQKTRPGGIAVFELSVKGGYFSLIIYALETSRIKSMARSVRNEEANSFLEDCSKLRDLTFIKSFYYDFHLRHIYQFISGKQPGFEQGYSVQNLLRKMLNEFPLPPSQSWSTLKEGTVKLPCAHMLKDSLVYNYMVANCRSYGLSVITVNEPLVCGTWETNQILTISLVTTKNPTTFSIETKRIDKQMIITPYHVDEVDIFALHFYMLLVNRKDVYLRPSYASKQSRLKIARQRAISGSEGGSLTSVGDHQAPAPVKHRVRFNSSTKVGSGEYMDLDSSYNTESLTSRVASLPGSFQAEVPYSFSSHNLMGSNTTSGSDTILGLTNASPVDHRKLSTQSLTPDIKPSDSSDSDSSSWTFSTRSDRMASFGQLHESSSSSDTRFIAEETTCANKLVQKACIEAMTDCWRDAIWYGILLSIQKEGDVIRKKKKEKDVCVGIDLDRWKVDSLLFQQHNTTDQISHDLIQRLVRDVTSIPLSKIDPELQCSLSLCTTAHQMTTIRHLSSKFECLCRSFTSSANGNTQSFVIINPNNYDMMIHLTFEDAGQLDVSVLFRQAPSFDLTELRHSAGWKPQEIVCLQHLENVLTCLCFSLWTRLLPL